MSEQIELPVFFVKDLPLPLGFKTANIIEPRYRQLIGRHEVLVLVYSDPRGFAATGVVVKIEDRIDSFRNGSSANADLLKPRGSSNESQVSPWVSWLRRGAVRINMRAVGVCRLLGFSVRPDKDAQIYGVAKVHTALPASQGEGKSARDLLALTEHAFRIRSTLFGSPPAHLAVLQEVFWNSLLSNSKGSGHRTPVQGANDAWVLAWRVARLLTWTQPERHKLLQAACGPSSENSAESTSLVLSMVLGKLRRVTAHYRRALHVTDRQSAETPLPAPLHSSTQGTGSRRADGVRWDARVARIPEAVAQVEQSVVTVWPRGEDVALMEGGALAKGCGVVVGPVGAGLVLTSAHLFGGWPGNTNSPQGRSAGAESAGSGGGGGDWSSSTEEEAAETARVVREGAEIEVTLFGGAHATAVLLRRFDGLGGILEHQAGHADARLEGYCFGGSEFDADLALLQILPNLPASVPMPPPARLGSACQVHTGDPVLALGHPGDLWTRSGSAPAVTRGVVSALVRPTSGEVPFRGSRWVQASAGSTPAKAPRSSSSSATPEAAAAARKSSSDSSLSSPEPVGDRHSSADARTEPSSVLSATMGCFDQDEAQVPVPDALLLDGAAVYVASDARLFPGMSGGPLVAGVEPALPSSTQDGSRADTGTPRCVEPAAAGVVIGLNTYADFELPGIGFALTIDRALDLLRWNLAWREDHLQDLVGENPEISAAAVKAIQSILAVEDPPAPGGEP